MRLIIPIELSAYNVFNSLATFDLLAFEGDMETNSPPDGLGNAQLTGNFWTERTSTRYG
jgi:hypothetical protein